MSENYETKLIGIQNGRNFRELGGYKTMSGQTIKYNKLLRTGNLADLSSSDLELLQKHGVKYDVDFRTEKEKNDYFYVCSLIEYTARQTKNKTSCYRRSIRKNRD